MRHDSSADEAQAWVEYCNGTGNTYWANLRRQHGYPEPHGVTYWGLGNEMYGSWQIGALSAEDYVEKAREFAKAMKLTDPSIQLVSCGCNGWSDWDRIVLEGLARYVDFHSIHIYTGSYDYFGNVFAPHLADFALASCQALIDRVRYEQGIDHPIYVAYDEWNVWFRERGYEASVAGLEERYTLADALAVATYLNIFIRRCRTVRLANLAQMVNVIAPIFTSPEGLFLQSIYHPLRLYAEWTLEVAIDTFVEAETYHLSPEQEARSPWQHRIARLGPFGGYWTSHAPQTMLVARSRWPSSTGTRSVLSRPRSSSSAPRYNQARSSARSTALTRRRRIASSNRRPSRSPRDSSMQAALGSATRSRPTRSRSPASTSPDQMVRKLRRAVR